MVLKGRKFLFSGVVLLLAIGYLGYVGFQGSVTYYYTVGELLQQRNSLQDENIRVNGQVVPGSIEKEPDGWLKFTITDSEGDLPAIYQGIVPDAFKAGNDVVLEGHLNPEGVFQANTIVTKCPSKYVPE